MVKHILMTVVCPLVFLGQVANACEESESNERTLKTILSLGKAIRCSEPEEIEANLTKLTVETSVVDILLDQVYPRQATPAEVIVVSSLLSELNADNFPIREAATKRLSSLGMSVDMLLADLLAQGSQEVAGRLARTRRELRRARSDRLIDLNLAAEKIFSETPIESLRVVARSNLGRLTSDPGSSESEDSDDLIKSVNWISARLIGSLSSSRRRSDLQLFAGASLQAAKENPKLAIELFQYIHGWSSYADPQADLLEYDFTELGLEIVQLNEIPYQLWELALELGINGSYELIGEPSDTGNPFEAIEGQESRNRYTFTPEVSKMLRGILLKSTGKRKYDLRHALRRSTSDAQDVVRGMLEELRVSNDFEELRILTNHLILPIDTDHTDEVLKVYLERLLDDHSSEKLKIGLLKIASGFAKPKELATLISPLITSDNESLRDHVERYFIGSSGRATSSRILKMIAELVEIAESNSSEVTREAAVSLYARWRSGVITKSLVDLEAVIADQVSLDTNRSRKGFPGGLSSHTLDLLADRLVNCPVEKLAPYWKKLLSFDDTRHEAALYGILQQPPSKRLFSFAGDIANHCVESEYARSIVRKWTAGESTDNPFLVLSRSHPDPAIRKELNDIMLESSRPQTSMPPGRREHRK